jgi:hypothetical protein
MVSIAIKPWYLGMLRMAVNPTHKKSAYSSSGGLIRQITVEINTKDYTIGSYTVKNGLYMVIIWLMMVNNNLVGGIPTPLKNMKVSWDDDIPNIWKNKKYSKPPTSNK